jgi:hypothetical protein
VTTAEEQPETGDSPPAAGSVSASGPAAAPALGLPIMVGALLVSFLQFGWDGWRDVWWDLRGEEHTFAADLSCDDVLTVDDADQVLGTTEKVRPPTTAVGPDADHLDCSWSSDDEGHPVAVRIDLRRHAGHSPAGAGAVAHDAYDRRRAGLRGRVVQVSGRGGGDESVLVIGGQRLDPKRPRAATVLLRRDGVVLQVDMRSADSGDGIVALRARTAAITALGNAIAPRGDE